MDAQAEIHVIKKADISEHKVLTLSTILPTLLDRHVRVRSTIVSLTSTNLSYAQLGGLRNWWDAYPVPTALHEPFNDQKLYGIVPSWGYAEVLDSKVSGIEAGMLLWGFWPSTSLPVDLELAATNAANQWVEISEARKNLMSLYQRFFLFEPKARLASLSKAELDAMAWEAVVRPIWEAGYLLNAAVYGNSHIHPGDAGPWSEADADLSSAVVISLSASGKTARAFAEGLVNHRSTDEQPVGFVGITSTVKSSLIPQAKFPTKIVSYGDMTDGDTVQWIKDCHPTKIVIADFGGRGDSLPELFEALKTEVSNAEIVVIGVGGNPTMRTPQDLGRWAQRKIPTGLNRIQMNTSPIREALLRKEGPEAYFRDVSNAWTGFHQSTCAQDVKLQLGVGISGDDGFEGGWTRLCKGEMAGDLAWAFRI